MTRPTRQKQIATRRGARGRPARGRSAGLRLNQRGVALIMVTAVVAILTAVAVEFTWRQRVNMHLAANARDELRAYYMARSAVNLSRVLLAFQAQLEGMSSQISNLMNQAGGGGNPQNAQNPQNAAGAPAGGMNIRLWDLVPIDCGLVQMAVAMAGGGGGEVPLDPDAPMLSPFGDFQGGCQAEIEDEESKINVNQLAGLGSQQQATLLALNSLMQDPRYDFLFDEEDRWGIRLTRPELIVALTDYVDKNQVQETLTVDENGLPQLVPGSGDESYYYEQMEPEQRPKNALFDSIDELNVVPGVGDYFMTAFADQLTVYTGKNAKLNPTPQNMPDLCLRMVIAARDPVRAAQLCADPVFMTGVWEQIELARASMPAMGISAQQLQSIFEQAGIEVNPLAFGTTGAAVFGSGSKTFTITATGQAGDVEKTIKAVVSFDPSMQSPANGSGNGSGSGSGNGNGNGSGQNGSDALGRLLHWEEL